MKEQFNSKFASEQEITLYCYIGESVSAIQHLEDCLNHSIVIKSERPKVREEADSLLLKYRSFTLGKAINLAEKHKLYSELLFKELRSLLSERNWLIHKSISQSRDDWDSNILREDLLLRIKTISDTSFMLMRKLEDDLITFSEENGVNMSQVKAELHKYNDE
ncbi:hypothetical protein [Aliivibrio fischeri]|uniref:hypothetical protein n=1 Tax=Aliivibrio fischeri TaxID=668 RepID=UPI0012D9F55D|nr:hypothetical protein [Aliivibrio fischeri]MUI54408.1 hypothetical protein [Aliivibrio fischeri]